MNVLIIKLGATGDVVRTSTLLNKLKGKTTWITEKKNSCIVEGIVDDLRSLCWEEREAAQDRSYDLIINLEDTVEVANFCDSIDAASRFGAYSKEDGSLSYTEDSKQWFDLSLISSYGRKQADQLKLQNRRTYQDLIFEGLGFDFRGELYVMPEPTQTDLNGDIAISPKAGPVWPIKNWPYYDKLQLRLEAEGLTVNVLPKRDTLLEHLGDISQHRCVVGGDSLPMHLALGLGVPCVSLFTCTSPWEIHDYGLLTKLVSPILEKHFYQRSYDHTAASAIGIDDVFKATMERLEMTQK
jgi:heptosyltransferase II